MRFLQYLHFLHCLLIVPDGCLSVKTWFVKVRGNNLRVYYSTDVLIRKATVRERFLPSSRAAVAKRSLFHFVILRAPKDLTSKNSREKSCKTRFFTAFRMTIYSLSSSRASFEKRSRYTSQKQIATSLRSSQRRKMTWARRSSTKGG